VVGKLEFRRARENDEGFVVAELDMKATSRAEDALPGLRKPNAGLRVVEDQERMARRNMEEREGDVVELEVATVLSMASASVFFSGLKTWNTRRTLSVLRQLSNVSASIR
jgi:hypothetical protein